MVDGPVTLRHEVPKPASELSRYVAALHDVTLELQSATTTDELCRMAVELGRKRLGFDRLGIWFPDGPDAMRGSFGTDEKGRTRDERKVRLRVMRDGIVRRLQDGKLRSLMVRESLLLNHRRKPVGQGTRYAAALWSGARLVGVITADNLLTGQPVTAWRCQLLELLAGRLSILIERLRAQRELHDSEERFRIALNSSAITVATVDRNFRYTWVYNTRHGFKPEQVIGKRPDELIAPEDAKELMVALRKVFKSKAPVRREIAGRSNGVPWNYDLTAEPLRNGKGRVIGITLSLFDLSERKKMEEALRQSEERYRMLVEGSPDAVTVHREGVFLFLNPAALKLYGAASADDLLGHLVLDRVHPEDRALIAARIRQASAGLPTSLREQRVVTMDGKVVVVEASSAPIIFQGQKATQVVIRDITKRKQIEEELLDKTRILDALMDFAPVGIAVADGPEATISAMSNYGKKLYGGPAEGLNMDDIRSSNRFFERDRVTPLALDKFPLMRAIANGETVTNDVIYLKGTREKQLIPFLCNAGPIRDYSANIVGGIVIWRDIAEQMRMQESLEESEARFRSLIENGTDIITILDEQGCVTYESPSFERILGTPVAAMLGRSIFSIVHPDDLARAQQALGEFVARPDTIRRIEVRARHRDGSWREFAVVGRNLLSDPAVRGIVLSSRDITDSKKNEAEIRLHSQMLSAMSEGVVMTRASDGTIQYTNPKFAEMFGYGPGELIGRHVSVLNAPGPDSPEDLAKKIISEVATSGSWKGTICNVRKDGSTFWTQANVVKITHPVHGEVWLAAQTDITALKEVEQALRTSEEQFRAIFEQSAVGVALMDTNTGRFLNVNQRMCEIAKSTREEILTTTFQDITHPDDLQYCLDHLAKLKSGLCRTYSIEKRNLYADGQITWVNLTVAPMWAPGEVPTRHVSVVEDITERKRTEELLRIARNQLELRVKERTAELEDANRQLHKLVAELAVAEERERRRISDGIHDDVSQTLIASKIELTRLYDGAKEGDIAAIGSAVEAHIDRVISRLRTLTFELVSPVLRQFGLAAAVEELCEKTEQEFDLAVSFENDPHPKPLAPEVEMILYRAASELLHNIIKHARAQKVRVALTRTGDTLQLTVEDDGVGFDNTRPPEGFTPGGGYGLFTIRERLQHLRGRLHIEQATPQGSRIILTVPIKSERIES